MKRELAACEQRMAELGLEIAKLEALLATNPAPAQIADTGRRLKAAGDELQALEEQWPDLSQRGEQIEQRFEARRRRSCSRDHLNLLTQ